ncbi:hypothetical protein NP493_1491g00002 [Ridgeia piscesae]|uniref:Uncharacterized protein n=1 Tax=Ridgeia piscesae TaxID=27915 RepID=A0AAD9K116_RIDPI|nr:hypothetical protein NP493_1491g00002 [Ridgeia piscesae]
MTVGRQSASTALAHRSDPAVAAVMTSLPEPYTTLRVSSRTCYRRCRLYVAGSVRRRLSRPRLPTMVGVAPGVIPLPTRYCLTATQVLALSCRRRAKSDASRSRRSPRCPSARRSRRGYARDCRRWRRRLVRRSLPADDIRLGRFRRVDRMCGLLHVELQCTGRREGVPRCTRG